MHQRQDDWEESMLWTARTSNLSQDQERLAVQTLCVFPASRGPGCCEILTNVCHNFPEHPKGGM